MPKITYIMLAIKYGGGKIRVSVKNCRPRAGIRYGI